MRFVFLLGGVFGFVVAGATSWLSDCGSGRVLFDAACGCLVGALLFRWLWSVLMRGLHETLVIRQRAAVAAAEAKNKP
ncbi:MAG TPA: hypothetical protein VHD32_00095 [Candidatus Didemnitutus sp.]|nr:hypothetical protein [Candidatus Didemnitutus sp.]